MVGARRVRQFEIHQDVAAVATSAHFVHVPARCWSALTPQVYRAQNRPDSLDEEIAVRRHLRKNALGCSRWAIRTVAPLLVCASKPACIVFYFDSR